MGDVPRNLFDGENIVQPLDQARGHVVQAFLKFRSTLLEVEQHGSSDGHAGEILVERSGEKYPLGLGAGVLAESPCSSVDLGFIKALFFTSFSDSRSSKIRVSPTKPFASHWMCIER
jgi:hypothetical protein